MILASGRDPDLPHMEIAVMAKTSTALSLEALLLEAETSDFYEEIASDFLWDKGIPLLSHSRQAIVRQAWRSGWRPAL